MAKFMNLPAGIALLEVRAAGWRRLVVTVCSLATLLAVAPRSPAADSRSPRSSQPSPWSSRVTIAWSGVPLRKSVNELAGSQRIGILLDRRIDPDQQLKLELSNAPLDEAVREIAAAAGARSAVLADVAYLGPADRADELRTLSAQLHDLVGKLPAARRRAWLTAAPLEWPELATPREVLERLAAEGGIALGGLDALPHDLWAAVDTPPLPLVDRLLLVAMQFDRTLEPTADGRGATLVPIAEPVLIERKYSAGRDPQALLRRWREAAPDAQLRLVGDQLIVRARIEDHQRLHGGGSTAVEGQDVEGQDVAPTGDKPSRRPVPRRPANDALARTRIDSFVVEGKPLDLVIETLGKRLDLNIEFDSAAIEAAGINVKRLVSLKLERATVDELLAATLRSAGLVHERAGRRVLIRPDAAAEPTRP
ncbi:MAG: STN domain-containing protein [Pirellulales bacterium]